MLIFKSHNLNKCLNINEGKYDYILCFNNKEQRLMVKFKLEIDILTYKIYSSSLLGQVKSDKFNKEMAL
jgi:hypothetical protein